MTREEAWNEIDAIIGKHEIDDEYVTITREQGYKALRVAREALEQQTEDAISRQAVLDCLTVTKLKKFDFVLHAREEIKKLPPVTPQPKTGHSQKSCDTCEHSDEIDGSNCYECVKGMRDRYNPKPKTGCEGCIYEKTGTNSTYPCSHCGRCYTDKYKAENEGQEITAEEAKKLGECFEEGFRKGLKE